MDDSKKWKLVKFLLCLLSPAMDWYILIDLVRIEEGLVYGPLSRWTLANFMGCLIVGCMVLIAKTCLVSWSCCKESKDISEKENIVDITDALIYQLPKLVIKYIISSCRELGINLIFFITCAVDGALFLVPLLRSAYATRCRTEDAGRKRKLGLLLFALSATNIGLTVTIAVRNAMIRGPDGKIGNNYRVNIWSKTYNMDRYFENVSVYFSHPKLDKNLHYSKSDLDFIKLYPFYGEIFDRRIGLQSPDCFPGKNVTYLVKFSDIPNTDIFYFQIWKYKSEDKERYKVFRYTGSVVRTDEIFNINTYHVYTTIITSQYISPDDSTSSVFGTTRAFGTIRFNWKVRWSNNTCTSPNVDYESDWEHLTSQAAVLHYFKYVPTYPPTVEHLLEEHPSGDVRFFSPEMDLIDIGEVWRPGFQKCDSTGNHAPIFDANIAVPCPVNLVS